MAEPERRARWRGRVKSELKTVVQNRIARPLSGVVGLRWRRPHFGEISVTMLLPVQVLVWTALSSLIPGHDPEKRNERGITSLLSKRVRRRAVAQTRNRKQVYLENEKETI